MSSVTPFGGYLVFVTLRFYPWSCVSPVHWSPSAASPSCRETGEVLSLDAKTGNIKVDFQAAQFICFQKSILSISPSSPTLPLPFPSLSLFLFRASHRLAESQARVAGGVWRFILVPTTLCWMGGWVRARKEWGKKGRGGKRKYLWEVVDFWKQIQVLSLFHLYFTSKSGKAFQSRGAGPEKVLSLPSPRQGGNIKEVWFSCKGWEVLRYCTLMVESIEGFIDTKSDSEVYAELKKESV